MKVPVRLLAFAAVAVILAAMCSGCVMSNGDHTLAPLGMLATMGMALGAIWGVGVLGRASWREAGALVLMALLLAGCSTTDHIDLGDPKEATKAASCGPLPLCSSYIPINATPKQLVDGLYACVLEYRALYSVCYHMANGTEGGK